MRSFPTHLFLLGVITRLIGFSTASIWYDEAISLWRSKLPMNMLLKDGSELQGFNLWEFVLRGFNANIYTLRLPGLLMSIATLYIAWRIMRKLEFKPAQVTVAMIGLACLPGLLWCAQDARYYAPLGFFFTLAVWAGLERNNAWLLPGSAVVLILLHPTGAAWAIAAYLVALLGGMTIGSMLPVLPFVITVGIYKAASVMHGQVDSVFWLQQTDMGYFIIQSISAVYLDTLGKWWPLGFAVILGLLLPVHRLVKDKSFRLVYVAVITPIVIMLIVGAVYTPVLFYRTMQPGMAMLCLLAGYLLMPDRKWISWVLPVLASATLVIGMVNWSPASRGGDIRQAAEFIKANWQPGDVIYYGTGTAAMPFDYYLHDLGGFLMDAVPNRNLNWPGIPFTETPLEDVGYRRAWIVYPLEPLMDPSDAARLERYTQDGTLVQKVQALQFAPIVVYLVEK